MLPFYVAFLLLAVDFGLMGFTYVSLANGVREGARYAATVCAGAGCTEGLIDNRVIERSGGIPGVLASEVDVWWNGRQGLAKVATSTDCPGNNLCPHRGDSYVVRVNHPYTFHFVPGGINISVISCADMRLEDPDFTSTVALHDADDC